MIVDARPQLLLACLFLLSCMSAPSPFARSPPVLDAEDLGGIHVTLEVKTTTPSETLEATATVITERLRALGSRRGTAVVKGSTVEVFVPAQLAPQADTKGLFAEHRLAFYEVLEERPIDQPGTLANVQRRLAAHSPDHPNTYIVSWPPAMTHEAISSGIPVVQPEGPSIHIVLTESGAQTLTDLTTRLTGRALAIAVDDRVAAAPVIREPIQGGRLQISGLSAESDAYQEVLASLKTPPLPAPVEILTVSTVAPD